MSRGYRECEHCHTRLLLVRGAPPLNWGQDPAGEVAVTITSPRTARFLGRGEDAGPLEHRHSVHACDGTRHAAQRQDWQDAISARKAAQRRGRGRRGGPQVLPGMARVRAEEER